MENVRHSRERGAESGERQDDHGNTVRDYSADAEMLTRSHIAQLLTARCNNCYSRLPGKVGCNVHSPGWNWVTGNFGPFCDDCFKELKVKVIEWAKYYRGDK